MGANTVRCELRQGAHSNVFLHNWLQHGVVSSATRHERARDFGTALNDGSHTANVAIAQVTTSNSGSDARNDSMEHLST